MYGMCHSLAVRQEGAISKIVVAYHSSRRQLLGVINVYIKRCQKDVGRYDELFSDKD